MQESRYSVGIDLHKTIIQVCVLDATGTVIEERRFEADLLEEGLRVVDYLGRWRQGGRFAVEAVGLNRWFVNACRESGLAIVVVDPTKLNLKMLGRKTDRRDAYEIARRLHLGDIDRNATTYYPTEEEYAGRKVLRVRHKLVSVRQQLVNQVRSLLRAYKVPAPKGSLYSARGLAALKATSMPNDTLGKVLGLLVGNIEAIHASIMELTGQIEASSKSDPQIAGLIDLLPSVGPQTAATLILELGEVSRLRDTRAAASYAGLAPRVANSADVSHHGPITKRGNRELRWILSEWSVRLLSRDPRVKEWAQPRLRRMHKNKVRMTLARKLLVGVYVMLRNGEPFSLERCLAA